MKKLYNKGVLATSLLSCALTHAMYIPNGPLGRAQVKENITKSCWALKQGENYRRALESVNKALKRFGVNAQATAKDYRQLERHVTLTVRSCKASIDLQVQSQLLELDTAQKRHRCLDDLEQSVKHALTANEPARHKRLPLSN